MKLIRSILSAFDTHRSTEVAQEWHARNTHHSRFLRKLQHRLSYQHGAL